MLEKYYPSGVLGLDRDGDPIIWNAFGNMDFRGIYVQCTHEIIQFLRCTYIYTYVHIY